MPCGVPAPIAVGLSVDVAPLPVQFARPVVGHSSTRTRFTPVGEVVRDSLHERCSDALILGPVRHGEELLESRCHPELLRLDRGELVESVGEDEGKAD